MFSRLIFLQNACKTNGNRSTSNEITQHPPILQENDLVKRMQYLREEAGLWISTASASNRAKRHTGKEYRRGMDLVLSALFSLPL
jgi:hypothetical protein